MIVLDTLHTPLDLQTVAERAQAELLNNRLLSKVGMAALILDQDDNALVNIHEASDGEFAQRSWGPLMETYRFVYEDDGVRIETPYEAFQRSLNEELAVDKGAFGEAGFYFDMSAPVTHGEWNFGPSEGFNEKFALAASVIVRVFNPEVLTSAYRLSEESLGTRFMPLEAILTSREPQRPGYKPWLTEMIDRIATEQTFDVSPILEWTVPPITGDDVRFPFSIPV